MGIEIKGTGRKYPANPKDRDLFLMSGSRVDIKDFLSVVYLLLVLKDSKIGDSGREKLNLEQEMLDSLNQPEN